MKNYKNPEVIIIQCNQDCITTSAELENEKNSRDDVVGFDVIFG